MSEGEQPTISNEFAPGETAIVPGDEAAPMPPAEEPVVGAEAVEQEVKAAPTGEFVEGQRYTGKVKWFDLGKGWGFIIPDGGGADVFVHQRDIQTDGTKQLSDGQDVAYTFTLEKGKAKAREVTNPDGSRFGTGTSGASSGVHPSLSNPAFAKRLAEDSDLQAGKVKWFDAKKGFGFIVPVDGGPDVFAHQSVISSTGYRQLEDGQDVEFRFKVEISADGKETRKATQVTAPGGFPVVATDTSAAAPGAAALGAGALGALAGLPYAGMLGGMGMGMGMGLYGLGGALGAATSAAVPPRSNVRTGTVKWFDPAKGYGFIIPSEGGPELFVHQTNIISATSIKSLDNGQLVEFEVETKMDKGQSSLRAANVTGVGGVPIMPSAAAAAAISKKRKGDEDGGDFGDFSGAKRQQLGMGAMGGFGAAAPAATAGFAGLAGYPGYDPSTAAAAAAALGQGGAAGAAGGYDPYGALYQQYAAQAAAAGAGGAAAGGAQQAPAAGAYPYYYGAYGQTGSQ